MTLALEYVRNVLSYNPENGLVTWKIKVSNNTNIGDIAGFKNVSNRYYITLKNKKYLAHRIIWFLVYGELPKGVIDHIDGNSLNNRLDNLRVVNQRINLENQRKAKSSNKVGYLGVSLVPNSKTKFYARIKVMGVTHFLGCFNSPEEAHEMYVKAKRSLHEGNTL